MENYFNYFTEIEEHFQRRRGSLLLLSTLDWSLIDTWREAGIPLAAVLRGIDSAFDKYEARNARSRAQRVNGLAWCAQAVLTAAEEMREAAVGAAPAEETPAPSSGFEQERVAAHLDLCATQLHSAALPGIAAETARAAAARLQELAVQTRQSAPNLEDLDRNLIVLEEKLLNALIASSPEEELLALRQQSARELAPYRSRMQAVQLRQIEQQFLHRRLFEKHALPRLSLFYMSHA